MTKRNFSILFFLIAATSCSLFQKDTFQGLWTLSVTGDYNGTIDFVIDEKNEFKFSQPISTQGQNYDAQFIGKISEDGTFLCDVFVMGMKVADFSGKLNYENGSGNWSGSGMGGNWTAVKK